MLFPQRHNIANWMMVSIGKRAAANHIATPGDIAAAIRNRLHARYDDDEVKQSRLTLTGTDPMSFNRIFCLLPYLPDGKTDMTIRPILESYVQRLLHEKYAATDAKVLTTLRNIFKARADGPALVNFIAPVKWIDPESAVKLIGMPAQPLSGCPASCQQT